MKDKFDELYKIVQLDRKNSPWSRSQSLKNRIEELYSEVVEIRKAVDNNDTDNLREELGDAFLDLLAVVVICEEKGLFDGKDAVQEIITKMKRRKPWIFTRENLTVDEEVDRWNQTKKIEKQTK